MPPIKKPNKRPDPRNGSDRRSAPNTQEFNPGQPIADLIKKLQYLLEDQKIAALGDCENLLHFGIITLEEANDLLKKKWNSYRSITAYDDATKVDLKSFVEEDFDNYSGDLRRYTRDLFNGMRLLSDDDGNTEEKQQREEKVVKDMEELIRNTCKQAEAQWNLLIDAVQRMLEGKEERRADAAKERKEKRIFFGR